MPSWNRWAERVLETCPNNVCSLFAEAIVACCSLYAASPLGPAPALLRLSTRVYDLVLLFFLRNKVDRCVSVLKALTQASFGGDESYDSALDGSVAVDVSVQQHVSSHLITSKREPERRVDMGTLSENVLQVSSRVARPLFSVAVVTGAIQDALRALHINMGSPQSISATEHLLLVNALIYVYSLAGRFDDVVRVYMDERHRLSSQAPSTGGGSAYFFELLEEHSLGHLVAHCVQQLVELDVEGAVKFMAAHGDVFPVDDVVSRLRPRPVALLAYLHALLRDRRAEYNVPELALYHDLQLQLYEKHDRKNLLPFLVASRQYRLREARELLSRAQMAGDLLHELAHVTYRMGDIREALRILVVEARDVRAALVLVQQLDDPATWRLLVQITVGIASGDVIGDLLDGISSLPLGGSGGNTYADVLRQIPSRVRIPRLQSRLLALLRDRRIHAALVTSCDEMVRSDVHTLVVRKAESQRSGLRVDAGVLCHQCQRPLSGRGARGGDTSALISSEGAGNDHDAIIFFCRHSFHRVCLKECTAQIAAATAEAAVAASRSRSRSRSSSVSSFLASPYRGQGGRRSSTAGAFDSLSGAASSRAAVGVQGSVSASSARLGRQPPPAGPDSAVNDYDIDQDEAADEDAPFRPALSCPVCTNVAGHAARLDDTR